MYKIKDIETRINNKTVDIGDIGCRFYTEDENTAYVRIGINDEKGRINFKESNLTPKLHLFTEDGSIFKNEPVTIEDYSNKQCDIAKELKIGHVSLYRNLGNFDLTKTNELMYSDGVHPNKIGGYAISNVIYDRLLRI